MSNVDPARVYDFVLRSFPSNNNPDAFVAESLKKENGIENPVKDYQDFYTAFIEPSPADKQLWDQVNPQVQPVQPGVLPPEGTSGGPVPAKTKAFFSNLLKRDPKSEQPMMEAVPPPLKRPEAPQRAHPPRPAPRIYRNPPRTSGELPDPYVEARSFMPRMIPVAPTQSNNQWVLVRPDWDENLRNMHIVDSGKLPGMMVIDRQSLGELKQADRFDFPQDSNPMPSGNIYSNQVKFIPVSTDKQYINNWVQKQPLDMQTEVVNPEWTVQTLTYARRKKSIRSTASDRHPASLPTHTASRVNTQAKRTERHNMAAEKIKDVMRQNKTVY